MRALLSKVAVPDFVQPDGGHGTEPRISIGGGLKIGADGSYSSEYTLSQVHARCADELVRMERRREVILAFRKAHDFPKGSRDAS